MENLEDPSLVYGSHTQKFPLKKTEMLYMGLPRTVVNHPFYWK